jgi:hypothetical protein
VAGNSDDPNDPTLSFSPGEMPPALISARNSWTNPSTPGS